MKKNIKTITVLIILTILSIGILFLLLNKKQKEKKPVRFGYLPLSSSLALYVAQENDFFDQENIKVELVKFESSNLMAEALISDSIDAEISASSFIMALLAQDEKTAFKIFMVNSFDKENYITALITKKDSNIENINDLKGKTIGCFPGATNKLYTKIYLEKYGAYDNKTSLVEIPPNLQLQALETGKVDALSTYEPFKSIGVYTSQVKVLKTAPVETEVLNPWIAGTVSFNTNFLQKRPQEAEKIKKAMFKAVDLMRNNPQEAKKTLAKYTPITDQEIIKLIPVPKTLKTQEININDFQKMINLLKKEGLFEKDIDLKNFILKAD
jgi:NitT/TauT family transport system substrate-binding protein